MADAPVLKASGLYTSPNTLSFNPEGALKEALNCVINFPGVVEPRRGFEYLNRRFGNSASRADALMSYKGAVLVQYDGSKLAHDTGVAFVDYAGDFTPPDAPLMRTKSAEVSQNFYFTTASGVRVLDAPLNAPIPAGLPKGPMCTGVSAWTGIVRLDGDPDTGWFPANSQVGYVAVYGRRDANDNVKLGEPSEPVYIANPADIVVPIGSAAKTNPFDNEDVVVSVASRIVGGTKIAVSYSPPDAHFTNCISTVASNFAGVFDYRDTTPAALNTTNTTAGLVRSGAKNVKVPVTLSGEAATDMFVQIYRAKSSTGEFVRPNADYFLVNERQITAGDLAAGFFEFTDSTPDDFLRSPLYINVNTGGETPDGSPENENQRPPLCKDLAFWDNRLWGANLQERQNVTVRLLGVGGNNGLVPPNTITIDGVVYTAGSGPAPSFQFHYNSGSVADDIQRTAESLVAAITQYAGSTVNAYYIKRDDELLGEIFLEARRANQPAFTVVVNKPSAWDIDGGSVTSTADVATNGLWFSKQGEPEAVPRLNRLSVGPKNFKLLRARPLGERLFVFTDRGVYTVSNTYPYRVDLLSKTAVLVAPDSLVEFDDALHCLTTQGFARVSDSGVGVISVPIEADVKRLFGAGLGTLGRSTTAVGYESYRKYIVSMPTEASDTDNTQQLVYDVATRTWTRWDKPVAAMWIVPETDYLHVAATNANTVSKERKQYDRTDYADESFAVSILAVAGKALTLASTAGISAGDLLWQAADAQSLVLNVVDGTTVEVGDTINWTVGLAVTCYAGISNRVIFSENFARHPSHLKHWPEVTYHFRSPGITQGQAVFSSELGPSDATVALDLAGWGGTQWAQFAWAQPSGPRNVRVFVPENSRRGAYLTVGLQVREAWGVWALYGYSAQADDMSTRSGGK